MPTKINKDDNNNNNFNLAGILNNFNVHLWACSFKLVNKTITICSITLDWSVGHTIDCKLKLSTPHISWNNEEYNQVQEKTSGESYLI